MADQKAAERPVLGVGLATGLTTGLATQVSCLAVVVLLWLMGGASVSSASDGWGVIEHDDCDDIEYESTWAAIQGEVFGDPDGGPYGCALCHVSPDPSGALNLVGPEAHGALVGVPSHNAYTTHDRVTPGEPDGSFLIHKLEGTLDDLQGSDMPPPEGGVHPSHIEAIARWIRAGAPETGVVAGTAELLDICLDHPTPIEIDPPEVPARGEGVQMRQTPWPLPATSEDEICVATYYDYTEVVPPEYLIECGDFFGANNPSEMCFVYNRQLLLQDPQAHHGILVLYSGEHDVKDNDSPPDRKFGPFSYKRTRDGHSEGESCDPKAIDTSLGFNPDCSGEPKSAVSCLDYGVDDFLVGVTGLRFAGSQEPYYESQFADGVYSHIPLSGVLVWDSHAFNPTETDTTMSQYLNLYLAESEDRSYSLDYITGREAIFSMWVPPFEKRENCWTYTVPEESRVFELTSHTHRFGVEFKIFPPPREPCTTERSELGWPDSCSAPETDPIYISKEYSDPLQLAFDPPLAFDSSDPADRTFTYCSVYDNGSDIDSPPVKRRSTSPPFELGGPCPLLTVACLNGPNRGVLCGGIDAICDDPLDPGKGICDACPVTGGATSEDEMLILGGLFYLVPEPLHIVLQVAALVTLAACRRYRSEGI